MTTRIRPRLKPRSERKPRARGRVPKMPTRTSMGLVYVMVYLPRDLARRIKAEAIDRDERIRAVAALDPDSVTSGVVEQSEGALAGVLAIRGQSGVIAQIVRDYFADLDSHANAVNGDAARSAER